MNLLRLPGFFVVACSLCTSAHASFLNNSTGLDNPDQTITFESVVFTPAMITTQFQDLGVVFSNAFPNPDPGPYPNISGNRLGNFFPGNEQFGLFTADFTTPLREVAFALATAPGTATVRALLQGNLVETASFATTFDSSVNFFGFKDILFDRITVSVQSNDRTFLFDNLQTVAEVPEPQTWALLLIGLGSVCSMQRRRRL